MNVARGRAARLSFSMVGSCWSWAEQVSGGTTTYLASAEIYDPVEDTFNFLPNGAGVDGGRSHRFRRESLLVDGTEVSSWEGST